MISTIDVEDSLNKPSQYYISRNNDKTDYIYVVQVIKYIYWYMPCCKVLLLHVTGTTNTFPFNHFIHLFNKIAN